MVQNIADWHSIIALLWCQEKPSGVYKMQETAWAAEGYARDHDGGAYSAPPDLLPDGEGLAALFPITPPPLSAFRASPVPVPNF